MVGWMGGEGGPNASIYDSSAKMGAMVRARRVLINAVASHTYVCMACDGDRHAIFAALVLPYYLDMVGWMGRKGDPNTTIHENNAKMGPGYVEDVFS